MSTCMFLMHFKNCSHLFWKKSLITSSIKQISIWFYRDDEKNCTIYRKNKKCILCAHRIGLNSLKKKTHFTSCIIEATISLGHKCLYLRKSIRIQGFCWLYIYRIFYHQHSVSFYTCTEKNDCQVKTVVLILSVDVQ